MRFKMVHENFNVSDLNASLAFYEKALGLKECRRKTADDGSYIIVYVKNDESGFDAEGFFGYVTDKMAAAAMAEPEQFRRFAGFTENMWRLGDEPSYKLAMKTIVPRLQRDEDTWSMFQSDITEEFREALLM